MGQKDGIEGWDRGMRQRENIDRRDRDTNRQIDRADNKNPEQIRLAQLVINNNDNVDFKSINN